MVTENTLLAAANNPSQETFVKASSTISDLAAKGVGDRKYFPGYQIPQSERMFTARSRGNNNPLTPSGVQDDFRGNWAYVKLMTSSSQYNEYLSGKTNRKLTHKGLIGQDGLISQMGDIDGKRSNGYDKFLLTGVSCQLSEKVQITEVFGDSEVVYYFGRQPIIFNLTGILIDSPDNNWFVDWLKLYDDFLRGSQTAKNYELVKIVLPNMAITGTISGFSWQQDASRDVDVPFSIQFIAKLIEPLPAVNNNVYATNGVRTINFNKAAAFLGQSQINSLKGQVADLTSIIQNPSASLREKGNALNRLGGGVGGEFGAFLENSKNTLKGFQSTIDGWTKQQDNYFNSVRNSALYQTVTSSLNGIRTNLFSPIYGILSSLTKLVSNAFNSATSLFNSVINPVRNILRDITNISKQAIALVNLVNNSITTFGRTVTGQLKGTEQDFKTAIKTLGKAAGVIATAPLSMAQSIANMFSGGILDVNSAFLKTSPKLVFVRPSLSLSGTRPATRLNLLNGVVRYAPVTANEL